MKKFILYLFSLIAIPALASFSDSLSEDNGIEVQNKNPTNLIIESEALTEESKIGENNYGGMLQLKSTLIVDKEKLNKFQKRTNTNSEEEVSSGEEFFGLGEKTKEQLSEITNLPISDIQDIDKTVINTLGAIIYPDLTSAARRTHYISFKSRIQKVGDANYYNIFTDILDCQYQGFACFYIIQRATLKLSASHSVGYPVTKYRFSNSLGSQEPEIPSYITLATYPHTINATIAHEINAKITAAINAGAIPTGTAGFEVGTTRSWNEQAITMKESSTGDSDTSWCYEIKQKGAASGDVHVQHEWIWARPFSSSDQSPQLFLSTTLEVKYDHGFLTNSKKEEARFQISFFNAKK